MNIAWVSKSQYSDCNVHFTDFDLYNHDVNRLEYDSESGGHYSSFIYNTTITNLEPEKIYSYNIKCNGGAAQSA